MVRGWKSWPCRLRGPKWERYPGCLFSQVSGSGAALSLTLKLGSGQGRCAVPGSCATVARSTRSRFPICCGRKADREAYGRAAVSTGRGRGLCMWASGSVMVLSSTPMSRSIGRESLRTVVLACCVTAALSTRPDCTISGTSAPRRVGVLAVARPLGMVWRAIRSMPRGAVWWTAARTRVVVRIQIMADVVSGFAASGMTWRCSLPGLGRTLVRAPAA